MGSTELALFLASASWANTLGEIQSQSCDRECICWIRDSFITSQKLQIMLKIVKLRIICQLLLTLVSFFQLKSSNQGKEGSGEGQMMVG